MQENGADAGVGYAIIIVPVAIADKLRRHGAVGIRSHQHHCELRSACGSVMNGKGTGACQRYRMYVTLLEGPEIKAELLASCAVMAAFAETFASRLGYSAGLKRRLSTTGPLPL